MEIIILLMLSLTCYFVPSLSDSSILTAPSDSCSYNGKTIQNGEFLISEVDPCQRCFCRRGRLRCRERTCPPLDCPNPSQRPKKCCPICRKSKQPIENEFVKALPVIGTTQASTVTDTQTVIIRLLPPPITPPPPPSESNNSDIIVEKKEPRPTHEHTTPIIPPPPMPPTPPATRTTNLNQTTVEPEDESTTSEPTFPPDACRLRCRKGPRGDRGPPGRRGHRGKKGKRGPRGHKGDRGEPGLSGDVGMKGLLGPVGPRGPSGLRGEKGSNGEKGAKGTVGSRGKKGTKGLPGSMGLPGVDGLPGSTGPQGPPGKGETGEPGVMGLQGSRGSNGNPGPAGRLGPPGPKGEPGDTIQGQIIIVPNESAMNLIQTEASIAYRMDDKKLYYRDDSSWNCLIAEDTLEEVKQNLVGPPGPQGLPGPRGPKGDKGDIGIMGDDGTIIQEARCGNGVTELHEQCDDGNDDPHDDCIGCRRAYCGDGYRRRNVEECDGNDFNGQTCGTSFPKLKTIGSLRCTHRCTIDIRGCTVVSS